MSDLGKDTKPLFIVMGGFGSCIATKHHGEWESPVEMQMTLSTKKITEALRSESGIEADILTSCFTKMAELRYSTSDDGFKKLHTSQKIQDVVNKVNEKIDEHSSTFIIGHSYGGWLSMKSLVTGKSNSSGVKAYYSLDPISRKYCRLENPINWGYCVEAPSDFTDGELKSIAENTSVWKNIWQENTSFLHSSEIAHADENKKLNVEHWDINNLSDVWTWFESDVRTDLHLN